MLDPFAEASVASCWWERMRDSETEEKGGGSWLVCVSWGSTHHWLNYLDSPLAAPETCCVYDGSCQGTGHSRLGPCRFSKSLF